MFAKAGGAVEFGIKRGRKTVNIVPQPKRFASVTTGRFRGLCFALTSHSEGG
ncbi:hypothetical protein I545_6995 [Mycobacterium kansasii 662]|uniref:Uncharacterized protein n=1 Tax=Mycobacterium kansasii 662 TaxID=1299326 RepID=X7XQE5_MYCKA|nr:hypothetical protein I545_6995 [Mycobacterium kansasii 662]